jgi:signal transduction histidine kinase
MGKQGSIKHSDTAKPSGIKEFLRILMLEDSADDADLIERLLRKSGMKTESRRVESRKDFEKALKGFKPDVILSDHTLPGFNSMEALKIAKTLSPQTPFILVTGTVSEEFAVMCLKAGADDYILKGKIARLPAAIEVSLHNHNLLKENIIIKKLNEEIENKNAELDRLNNEKDRFLSIVAHDLNNYISAMAGNIESFKTQLDALAAPSGYRAPESEVLREPQPAYKTGTQTVAGKRAKPERERSNSLPEQLTGLERNLVNMQTMLSDILTVNRIQNGIINPVYTLVNLGDLLNEVIKRNEDSAVRKNISLIYSNACNNNWVKTDASYFSIIADNLISNAIKFSHSHKKVWIGLDKKDNYIFQVKDEGQGIPHGEMPSLYRRFHKLSPKPTRNEPTNGLGLSIVKELVDTLNWTIECESSPGKGTVFTISIT